jgi:hypothetical protein
MVITNGNKEGLASGLVMEDMVICRSIPAASLPVRKLLTVMILPSPVHAGVPTVMEDDCTAHGTLAEKL